MRRVRILLTDDHKMIRDGLKVMLETYNGKYTFVIDEASSGEAAVEKVMKNGYDVVLLDYQLPGMDGAETARVIMKMKSEIKILALSNYNEHAYIDKMMKRGKVKGYILKNIDRDELVKAIETVLSNKIYYSNEIWLSVFNRQKSVVIDDVTQRETTRYKLLSKREKEVLRLISEENTNDTIAKTLAISTRTVEKHRENIIYKLHVHNAVGLVKAALIIFSLKSKV